VAHRVAAPGEVLLPDTPVELTSTRTGGELHVQGPDGGVPVAPTARLEHRGFDVEVGLVPRFRLPRFRWGQGDVALPVLMLASALFVAQLTLLQAVYVATNGGAGGFEPTPEYLARLLRGDHAGEAEGVIARLERPRPAGEPIDGFYLPAGHAGPPSEAGGGRNVGDRVRIGNPDPAPGGAEPAPPVGPGGELDVVVPNLDAAQDGLADADLAAEQDAGDRQPIAVEVTEGWGLSDWYDTQDAREDAKEIEQQLELARRILAIDPDDPNALMVRSYYEYLAMDYTAARRTYDRFRTLYPEDPAGWNNLALTYKREGDYVKEEELYRVALSLAPDDDHALVNLALCLGHQGRFEEAWAVLDKLEHLRPGDPYADLHRAKVSASQGKREQAYRYLQRSLASMRKLDTLHNIEFRQDIRLDPSFETMREEERFRKLLLRYYGDQPGGWWQRLGGGQ